MPPRSIFLELIPLCSLVYTSLKTSKGSVPTNGWPLGPTWIPSSWSTDFWCCWQAWCFKCILTGVDAREGGHLSAEEKGFVPLEHPATDLAPDAQTTTHHFVLLHGDPWLVIRSLTVVLFNEALKVSSRRHWSFFFSQTLLNLGRLALAAAIVAPSSSKIVQIIEDTRSLRWTKKSTKVSCQVHSQVWDNGKQ